MIPPKEITIKSDGNILTFLETLKPIPKGELQFIYKYTKSKSKKGTLLGLNEQELLKLISVNS